MMRRTPIYLMEDPAEVKRLVRAHPWATIVSATDGRGLVASHYPVLLDEGADGIVLLSHVGRPDEKLHGLGEREVLVIIQGPHGYISPGWYEGVSFIPTWNHVTAHLYGRPEILSDEENFRVLGDLVDHFEKRMPEPVSLDIDETYARRIAKGTVGIRLRVTRFDARLKLSQDKPAHVMESVLGALESDGPYNSKPLAAEMRRAQENKNHAAD